MTQRKLIGFLHGYYDYEKEAKTMKNLKYIVLSVAAAAFLGAAQANANPYVIIQTTKGPIMMELYQKDAPKTVENFLKLVDSHFYDGLLWHRYVPKFVIQGGDPQGTGRGGPGYTVPAEINSHKHLTGTVATARLPDNVNPSRASSGSQFYICLAPAPFLDNNYTIFGQVEQGMDNVMKLRRNDKMLVLTSYKNKVSAKKAYSLLTQFYKISTPYKHAPTHLKKK